MAAVKPKQSIKLKAGQKKKVNKWLVVGGVAAVAIIGAAVVRFSSASTWRLVAYGKVNWTVTTQEWRTGILYKTHYGERLRGCVTAYSTDRTKNAVVYITIGNSKYKDITIKPAGGKYCSEMYINGSGDDLYTEVGTEIVKRSGPNVWVTATSVEVLQ